MARQAGVLKTEVPGSSGGASRRKQLFSVGTLAYGWQSGSLYGSLSMTAMRAIKNANANECGPWIRLFALSVGVLPLGACSGSASTADSQVVATVNGSELTTAQLQHAKPFSLLDAQSNRSGDTGTHTLDTLIDEEFLVQEAHKAKLDSDVAVQREIERVARKILGDAYIEREITPRVTVSTDEMRAFYDRYPALFERRRIFEFAEFAVANNALSEPLRAELAQARSADELRNKLNRRAVKFVTSKQVLTAEQLPMDRMTELAKATTGDVLLMPQDADHTRLLAITAIEEDPQAFAQAQPRIEQYLVNSRAQQLLLDHLKLVRATATIAVPRSPATAAKPAAVADSPAAAAFQLGSVSHTGVAHATP